VPGVVTIGGMRPDSGCPARAATRRYNGAPAEDAQALAAAFVEARALLDWMNCAMRSMPLRIASVDAA
jgi:hypothetical protein